MFDFKACAVGLFTFSIMYGLFLLNSELERLSIVAECQKSGMFMYGTVKFECKEIKLK